MTWLAIAGGVVVVVLAVTVMACLVVASDADDRAGYG